MDKPEARIRKLRALVEEEGGPAEFARKRSRPDADKPIDPTFISQILNGHRSFGEKAAANMERRAGLPPRYFDDRIDEPNTEPAGNPAQELTPRQQALLGLFEGLTDSQQDALIRELQEKKQQNDELLTELLKRKAK